MVLYRYMYKYNKVIIDEFYGIDRERYYEINVENKVKKKIWKFTLNNLAKNNYIMWSTSNRETYRFANLVIRNKKEIIEGHKRKIVKLEEEIEKIKVYEEIH